MCHPIEHPTHIQSSMTLPTRPHAIFSTFAFLANTQKPDKKAKELKMPTLNLRTPADEYLSSFVQHFSNISLLGTQAHPPPSGRNSYEPLLKHEPNNYQQQPTIFDIKKAASFTTRPLNNLKYIQYQ